MYGPTYPICTRQDFSKSVFGCICLGKEMPRKESSAKVKHISSSFYRFEKCRLLNEISCKNAHGGFRVEVEEILFTRLF